MASHIRFVIVTQRTSLELTYSTTSHSLGILHLSPVSADEVPMFHLWAVPSSVLSTPMAQHNPPHSALSFSAWTSGSPCRRVSTWPLEVLCSPRASRVCVWFLKTHFECVPHSPEILLRAPWYVWTETRMPPRTHRALERQAPRPLTAHPLAPRLDALVLSELQRPPPRAVTADLGQHPQTRFLHLVSLAKPFPPSWH